jgi:lipopolysaccharide transport system permease protein
MVLWQIFTDSLNGPIQGVLMESGTLAKVKIPPESIILARLHDVAFNAVIKLLLVLCVFVCLKLPLTISLLIAPFAACSLILLGTLLGGLLGPISLLYDDFGRLLNLTLGYWFLITPVIYPAPKAGIFCWLVGLNPVTPLLVTTREIATGATLSCLPAFLIVTGFSIAGLMLSWVLFKLAMPFVVERKAS